MSSEPNLTRNEENPTRETAQDGLLPASDVLSAVSNDPRLTPLCVPCLRTFHHECIINDCECKKSGHGGVYAFDPDLDSSTESAGPVGLSKAEMYAALSLEEKSEAGLQRAFKQPEDVKDAHSTGRKRAVQLYPIEKGVTICEWAGIEKAGGIGPITGCAGNLATNVHHGPDKDTLNNRPGNVHRICAFCHNKWHALNDPVYNMVPQELRVWTKEEGNPNAPD